MNIVKTCKGCGGRHYIVVERISVQTREDRRDERRRNTHAIVECMECQHVEQIDLSKNDIVASLFIEQFPSS